MDLGVLFDAESKHDLPFLVMLRWTSRNGREEMVISFTHSYPNMGEMWWFAFVSGIIGRTRTSSDTSVSYWKTKIDRSERICKWLQGNKLGWDRSRHSTSGHELTRIVELLRKLVFISSVISVHCTIRFERRHLRHVIISRFPYHDW